MKILAIDIGNSRTKVGIFDDEDLLFSVSEATAQLLMPTGWNQFSLQISTGAGGFDWIAWSCVVPAAKPLLEAWLERQYRGIPVTKVCADNYPYGIDYSTPETLGSDRLADALGGFDRFGGPLIIVDFGTAVTLNIVNEEGVFLGGVIAPGSDLMMKTLAGGTGQLPEITVDFPPSPIGKSTAESIASGVTYGLVELVDGLIERVEASLCLPIPAIATGGNGRIFAELSKNIIDYHAHLTLEGIAEFARYEASQS